MPALFLNILKLIFLALIYLFLWQVARAMLAHTGAASALQRTRAGADVVVVRSEDQAGLRFTVKEGVVMGRSPDADVHLDDPYASDFHLRFGLQDGHVVVNDLGSTNGTYVNGRRVTSPVPLNKGDAVQVGKTIMEVR
jgi:pSer/pThr/pTyr-binding forkhead associated (FHA) protein